MLTDHVLQLIAEGSSKLASVPSGGAGGAPAAGGAAAGGAAEAVEEKKVEEGKSTPASPRCATPALRTCTDKLLQRRRSPTTTWDSVFSTKRLVVSRRIHFKNSVRTSEMLTSIPRRFMPCQRKGPGDITIPRCLMVGLF